MKRFEERKQDLANATERLKEALQQEEYKSDVFAKKQKKQPIKEEHTELIEYKENIFKRILNKIRQFFHI